MIIDAKDVFKNEMAEAINIALNENWREIFKSLESTIEDSFGKVARDLFNHVFDKTPYEELFKQ